MPKVNTLEIHVYTSRQDIFIFNVCVLLKSDNN